MTSPINHPVLALVFSFTALTFSVWFGGFPRGPRMPEGDARVCGVVEASMLTLLVPIAGFTLSMAIDRFEAVEAGTIGTEWLRLPVPGIHGPHWNLIHVRPANLDALATSLHAPP